MIPTLTDYRIKFLSYYIKQEYTTLLDVSCGIGDFARYWTWKGFRVSTTEGDEDLVIDRRSEGFRCEKVNLNDTPLRIPYNDDRFDVVTCTEVLEHITHPNNVIAEVVRVAKYIALFTFPVGQSYYSNEHINYWFYEEEVREIFRDIPYEITIEHIVSRPQDFATHQRSFVVAVHKDIPTLNVPLLNRPALQSLFGRKDLIGVEIGTERGLNAVDILTKLDIKMLYLIDPYCFVYNAEGNLISSNDNAIEREADLRLAPYSDKIHSIKDFSTGAITQIPNNVDFVYIDGNHETEAVKNDILLYFSKVKVGGILSGHDANKESVLQAIKESPCLRGLTVYTNACLDCRATDWFLKKE